MNINRHLSDNNLNSAPEKKSLLEEELLQEVTTHKFNNSLIDSGLLKSKRNAVLVQNAKKSYGEALILDNLNLSVKEGEIYALLGPSGCGKTSLLSCIVGLRSLDYGSISIFGFKPGTKESGVPGNRIGYVPQEISLFGEFKIAEALWYFGRISCHKTDGINNRIDFLLKLLNLPKKNRLIRTLSDGQKRRVSFAAALIHEPDLLILDEPTVGVDALLRECIWEHLVNLAAKNITIIITTHYIEEANQANKVGIMRNGRLLAEDTPQNLYSIYQEDNLQQIVIKLCIMDEKPEDTHKQLALESPKKKEIEPIVDPALSWKPWTKGTSAFRRLNALILRNYIRIWRNIAFVGFFMFVPAFATILFGFAIGGDIIDIKFGYVNNEVGYKNCANYTFETALRANEDEECKLENISCRFLNQFQSKTINLIEFESEEAALQATQDGHNWGYFVIPKKFTENLVRGYLGYGSNSKKSKIKVRMDMTSQPMTFSLQKAFYESMTDFANNISQECTGETYKRLDENIVELDEPIYGDINKSFNEYAMPSFLVVILFYMAITLSGLVLILEKKQGMYERSLVSGVTKAEVILSHLTTQYGVMLFQVFFALLFTFLLFKLPVLGPVSGVILMTIIQGTIGMLLGFVVSTICSEESSVMQLTVGLMTPIVLLSGMFWPLEGMPKFLQYICIAIPPTLASESMRSIMSRGWSFDHPSVYTGFLSSFAWIFGLVILIILVNKIFKNP